MKFNKIILGVLTLLFSFTLFSCSESEKKPEDDTTKTELKFKSAVLVSVEGTSDLNIKASVQGEKGVIYAVLSKEDSSPAASAIVEGKNFVWADHSVEGQALEATISELEAGKPYYAFFVIKHENVFSDIVRKTATTIEPDVDKGEGTAENPYKVSTIEDLEHVGTGPYDTYNLDWNADNTYYILENDIDLTSKYGENKKSWTPIKIGRESVFDGNGHTITGVYISTTSTTNLGLFEGINIHGMVKNLHVTNVRISSNGYVERPKIYDASLEGEKKYTSTNADGTAQGIYVGALTGDCKGSIENVHVTDAVLKVEGSRVGGLTGRLYSDEGTACKINKVSVEAVIEGVSRLGGIVGLIDAKSKTNFETPIVTNAYFKGTIKGTTTFPTEDTYIAGEYLGGFAGYARAFNASNIVVDATIAGERHVGGVVGFLQFNTNVPDHNSIIKDCLFKGNLSINIGTNMGPVVGNRSNSNATTENCIATGYYLSSSIFMKKEEQVMFDNLNATAKYGEAVEALSKEWYAQHLPSLDLESIFVLDENSFPTLR